VKFVNPFRQPVSSKEPERFDDWDGSGFTQFYVNGNEYITQVGPGGSREDIPTDFSGYVNTLYKRNGVVFACMAARQLLFSEARFQFRTRTNGRPGDLYGTKALGILEKPWQNGTTGELLSRMEQDASLAGNFYGYRRPMPDGTARIRRLRPDWVTIIIGVDGAEGDPNDVDAEVIGYFYDPQTRGGLPGQRASEARIFLPHEICHYSPIPDPDATFRGMSWLTPVLREVAADSAMTTHKLKFMENAATPNLVVKFDATVDEEKFKRFKTLMEERHSGFRNAYKTMYLGGGADATVVGNSFEQMSFKAVQGAGETRIAAAAGVPPVIVGLSEGLSSATYSNYAQARRRFADGTMRPLWRIAASSLANIVEVPGGSELWYDDRDIPFLQEDQKDAVEIFKSQAETVRALLQAGYDPDATIASVEAADLGLLKGKHSGLFSVQLLPPEEMGQPDNDNKTDDDDSDDDA
jgi:phage portal protein BeeE